MFSSTRHLCYACGAENVLKRSKHDIYPFISAAHRLSGAARGKTVVITGGGRGIGRATAKEFARAGARKIILAGRDASYLHTTKTEIERTVPSSCSVVPVATDVTCEEDVNRLFNKAAADVLVNNAGVFQSQSVIRDTDPQNWWRDFEVNLKGLYLCTRAFLLSLQRAGDKPAVVINIASSIADLVSPGMSSYGTSKLAVLRFTESVHVECADRGIRCIALHPGSIASTDMGLGAPKHFKHTLIDTVALAGGTALYLSTPEASFLAGRFVYSNWDMERLEQLKSEVVNNNLLISRVKYGDYLSSEVERAPKQKLQSQRSAALAQSHSYSGSL